MEPFASWNLFNRKQTPATRGEVAIAFRPMLEGLEDRCLLAAFTFTGATNNDWNTSGNWNKNGGATPDLPTQFDDVTIPANKTCEVPNNAGDKANSLTVAQGATLTLTGDLTVTNGVFNSGTMNLPNNINSALIAPANGKLQQDVLNGGLIVFGTQGAAGGMIDTGRVTNLGGQINVVTGGGITGKLVNSGGITLEDTAPQATGSSFVVDGNFEQTGGGTMNLHFYSKTASDFIIVSGEAKLDGTFNLRGWGGQNPVADSRWTVLQFATRVGFFSSYTQQLNGRVLQHEFLTNVPGGPETHLDFFVGNIVATTGPIMPNEGTAFNGTLATFTDPTRVDPTPADYHATVNWGDGTIEDASIVDNGQGGFDVVGDHPYLHYGNYQFTVTIEDIEDPADPLVLSSSAYVYDVAPQVTAGPPATIHQGQTYTGSGSFTDPGVNTWTAFVDYGDGSGLQPLTLNPDKTFALSHVYQHYGSYQVLVQVWDGAYYGQTSVGVTVLM